MMSAIVRTAAGLLALAALGSPAHAETYDAAPFPFVFGGAASSLQVRITSTQMGFFEDAGAIEQYLNGSTYSAVLSSPDGALKVLDNANSTWQVFFYGSGETSASLAATPTELTLDLEAIDEFTSVELRLLANDGSNALFRYGVDNDLWLSSHAEFAFGPDDGAYYEGIFGQSFVLPAVSSVPEPAGGLLMGAGIIALAAASGGTWRSRLRAPLWEKAA